MSVWLREIAGWVLLGVGLAAFAGCYTEFLLKKRLLTAIPILMMGFWIFRAGMHLIKVAVAARACAEAKADVAAAKPMRRAIAMGKPPAELRKSAVPGPTR